MMGRASSAPAQAALGTLEMLGRATSAAGQVALGTPAVKVGAEAQEVTVVLLTMESRVTLAQSAVADHLSWLVGLRAAEPLAKMGSVVAALVEAMEAGTVVARMVSMTAEVPTGVAEERVVMLESTVTVPQREMTGSLAGRARQAAQEAAPSLNRLLQNGTWTGNAALFDQQGTSTRYVLNAVRAHKSSIQCCVVRCGPCARSGSGP